MPGQNNEQPKQEVLNCSLPTRGSSVRVPGCGSTSSAKIGDSWQGRWLIWRSVWGVALSSVHPCKQQGKGGRGHKREERILEDQGGWERRGKLQVYWGALKPLVRGGQQPWEGGNRPVSWREGGLLKIVFDFFSSAPDHLQLFAGLLVIW